MKDFFSNLPILKFSKLLLFALKVINYNPAISYLNSFWRLVYYVETK